MRLCADLRFAGPNVLSHRARAPRLAAFHAYDPILKRRIQMKKLVLLFLCLMLLLGFTVSSWGAPGVINQSSTTATKVQYWGPFDSNYPITVDSSIPMEWLNDPELDTDSSSNWIAASEYKNLAYFSPSNPPFSTAAKWISFASTGIGPDWSLGGDRGTYVYRQTFKMPATAYNISSSAAIGADNYGWLYLNGELLVGPRDLTKNDRNYIDPPQHGCHNSCWIPKVQQRACSRSSKWSFLLQ
jgi:hypothetical protein